MRVLVFGSIELAENRRELLEHWLDMYVADTIKKGTPWTTVVLETRLAPIDRMVSEWADRNGMRVECSHGAPTNGSSCLTAVIVHGTEDATRTTHKTVPSSMQDTMAGRMLSYLRVVKPQYLVDESDGAVFFDTSDNNGSQCHVTARYAKSKGKLLGLHVLAPRVHARAW